MKTLTTLLTLGALLFPKLAQAQEPPETPVYEIALAKAPSDDITEHLVFNTLDDALAYEPTASGTVRLVTYPGKYQLSDLYTPIELRNKEIVGKYPAIQEPRLDANKDLVSYSSNSATIDGMINMKSNSRLSRIVKSGDINSVNIFEGDSFPPIKNVELSEVYFLKSPHPNQYYSMSLTALKVDNIIIKNNVFASPKAGMIIGNFQTGKPYILGNLFYNCEFHGIATCNFNSIFLGDELTRGDNIFIGNTKNIRLYSISSNVPAKWNYWYNTNKELLTTEESILPTIEMIDRQSRKSFTSSDNTTTKVIEVMPCHTTEPFTYSSAKSWTDYK